MHVTGRSAKSTHQQVIPQQNTQNTTSWRLYAYEKNPDSFSRHQPKLYGWVLKNFAYALCQSFHFCIIYNSLLAITVMIIHTHGFINVYVVFRFSLFISTSQKNTPMISDACNCLFKIIIKNHSCSFYILQAASQLLIVNK